MIKTSEEFISSIRKGDFTEFKSLISFHDTPYKNEEILLADFNNFKLLLASSKDADMVINVTNLYDNFGQRIVDIPIMSKERNIPADSVFHLKLLFGPPNINPLWRINSCKLTKGKDTLDGFRKRMKMLPLTGQGVKTK